MKKMPYFMTNPAWYKEVPLEDHDRGYELTDEAPEEAVKSYNEFYADTYIDKDGNILIVDF